MERKVEVCSPQSLMTHGMAQNCVRGDSDEILGGKIISYKGQQTLKQAS